MVTASKDQLQQICLTAGKLLCLFSGKTAFLQRVNGFVDVEFGSITIHYHCHCISINVEIRYTR